MKCIQILHIVFNSPARHLTTCKCLKKLSPRNALDRNLCVLFRKYFSWIAPFDDRRPVWSGLVVWNFKQSLPWPHEKIRISLKIPILGHSPWIKTICLTKRVVKVTKEGHFPEDDMVFAIDVVSPTEYLNSPANGKNLYVSCFQDPWNTKWKNQSYWNGISLHPPSEVVSG